MKILKIIRVHGMIIKVHECGGKKSGRSIIKVHEYNYGYLLFCEGFQGWIFLPFFVTRKAFSA